MKQALILAGGEGTRLRPLTINIPKPIVPIGNKPLILRQIETLKAAFITDITLSLNYHPSKIERVLGDGADFGVNLRYVVEPSPMGTAGAYKFAGRHLDQTTVVLNGDILTDVDLLEVLAHHREHQSTATIVLTPVKNPTEYGLVEVGENDRIVNFLEKPELAEIGHLNTINAGIYVLDPKVSGFIPDAEKYSFEYQLFPDLLLRKEKFNAFVAADNYWLDVGTHERYLQANRDWISGRIKHGTFEPQNHLRFVNAEIRDNSCIAGGCSIGPGARILNSVLGENVRIDSGAVIENSVIWAGTSVESDAFVSNSIIGCDCRIGKNARVEEGSVLGDNSLVSDFSFC